MHYPAKIATKNNGHNNTDSLMNGKYFHFAELTSVLVVTLPHYRDGMCLVLIATEISPHHKKFQSMIHFDVWNE